MNKSQKAEDQSISYQDWQQFFQEIESKLLRWRRDLHQYPEVGWTEYRTTYWLGQELVQLGYKLSVGKEALVSKARMGVPEPEVLKQAENRALAEGVPLEWIKRMEGGHTGLVACWETGRPGPHFAFRFDIDALPIDEGKEDGHFPYQEGFRSRYRGQMHACAHDGHAAIGLGLASWIACFNKVLNGSYTLLFQPAEEGSRGAKAMVEKGWLDDVDYFVAGHIGLQPLNIGDVVATTSGFLATSKLNVFFHGKAAHAGVEPEQGKNALLAAATAALHLQAIPRHSQGATRLNVGKLVAGKGRNIIPDQAFMEIETRGETTELNRYMVREAKRIIQAAAHMYDVQLEIVEVGEGLGGESDKEWVDIVQKACRNAIYVQHVLPHLQAGGSEDATYMMRRVQERGGKATYMVFGTPLPAGHHHPCFDFDERVLMVAVETLGRCILQLT
ncbi:amidohydrolase [Caldalkalibacillus thermarum TA2.A1]|uniref:Amidohydrolase n=1 Tax=Caldalkalibacillus thermarum (strain TA2.A1) TaxID=986075 RepID=F5LA34_CALTT|nr:amidohydrolase [Caldalkalibacillus thermarum]EGL81754.1 amidohydrolase [Caldalkalibacillus thermarum TA2.A1]